MNFVSSCYSGLERVVGSESVLMMLWKAISFLPPSLNIHFTYHSPQVGKLQWVQQGLTFTNLVSTLVKSSSAAIYNAETY